MSTNNNQYGQEVTLRWKDDSAKTKALSKLSGTRLARLVEVDLANVTDASLKERSIDRIDDLLGFSEKLRRLDLSSNNLIRLNGFVACQRVSYLNVSKNQFQGDSGLEELRYLKELRTLNIGYNDRIGALQSHIVKPLSKLQAFIGNDCGFKRVSFLKFLPSLNTIVLSRNQLKSFSIEELGPFNFLSKLSIGHNQLTSFPDLSSVSTLEELRINNNSITEIPQEFCATHPKLKTLDISHNLLSDWTNVTRLATMKSLTNLTLKGNRLPEPNDCNVDEIEIKEDVAGERLEDQDEKRYRRYVLSLFQAPVGKLQKMFVQLVVLDNRRVKSKWTQGGAAATAVSKGSGSASVAPTPSPSPSSSVGGSRKKETSSTAPREKILSAAETEVERAIVKKVKKEKRKRDRREDDAAEESVGQASGPQQRSILSVDSSDDQYATQSVLSSSHAKLPVSLGTASAADSGVVAVHVLSDKKRAKVEKRRAGTTAAGSDASAHDESSHDPGNGENESLLALLSGGPSAQLHTIGLGGSSGW
jgi:Leucine-rich repeat (LRR) protein